MDGTKNSMLHRLAFLELFLRVSCMLSADGYSFAKEGFSIHIPNDFSHIPQSQK